MESQESLLFNHMLPVKIRPAINRLWQVECEIKNKIGVALFTKIFCQFHVVKLDITLKPLNRFLHPAYHLKEETLGFLSMYKNIQSNAK